MTPTDLLWWLSLGPCAFAGVYAGFIAGFDSSKPFQYFSVVIVVAFVAQQIAAVLIEYFFGLSSRKLQIKDLQKNFDATPAGYHSSSVLSDATNTYKLATVSSRAAADSRNTCEPIL